MFVAGVRVVEFGHNNASLLVEVLGKVSDVNLPDKSLPDRSPLTFPVVDDVYLVVVGHSKNSQNAAEMKRASMKPRSTCVSS